MVTTRRGNTTQDHQAAEKKASKTSASAAGKKHRDLNPTVEEEKEEPEKKKSKSATASTPKKGKGRKKAEDGDKNESEENEGRPMEQETSVEESKDTVAGEKKGKEDTEMKEVEPAEVSAIAIDNDRGQKVEESPILEKGLVYLFLRGKVMVEHAESLDEVKRSYMVLRPLPHGAKLVDGKLGDSGKNRLIAIPKKRLPSKGHEKFLTFVEEPAGSLEDLREKYLKGRTYQTKTAGCDFLFLSNPISVTANTTAERELISQLSR
jgi:hypothetical protein